jgi:hypothetical protein
MADPATETRGDVTRPGRPWGCVLGVMLLLIVVLAIARFFSPADWVDVTVGPLPADYQGFCVLAEDSEGIGALPWYRAMVTTWTDDPFLSGTLDPGFWDVDNDGFIPVSVQWRDARRYGVLLQKKDGRWRHWWLEPGEVSRPSPLRWVFGGGKAEMRLPPEARAIVPSEELLRRLGSKEPPRGGG